MVPETVTPLEAQRHVAAGAYLVDVREADEWDEVHVAEATLIPLDSVEQRLTEIPRNVDIILMCRSGRRSGLAQKTLRQNGYESVANLAGGILAWEEDGLPVVR